MVYEITIKNILICKCLDFGALFALTLRNLSTGDKQPYEHFDLPATDDNITLGFFILSSSELSKNLLWENFRGKIRF